VPDEVKEAARNDKRWDSLIRHVKRQRKEVEGELEKLYATARGAVLLNIARRATTTMLRESRKRMNAQDRRILGDYFDGGREKGMQGLLRVFMREGELLHIGETLFDYVQNPRDEYYVQIDYNNPDDENATATVRMAVQESMTLTMLLWQVGDFPKPAWLTRDGFEEEVPNDLRRSMKMMLRQFTPQGKGQAHADAMRRVLATVPSVERRKAA
jgi:hypothetical protein